MSTGKMAGGVGLGGLIIVGLIALLMGGDPSEILQQMGATGGTEIVSQSGRTPTAEEEELAVFSKQILAGTEDVWTEIFAQNGRKYVPPKLVLYNDYVQTASGTASAQMGPFYNSADQTVYIDLSFFTSMKQQIGADGDFAYAYVIAHEVGHHVQYLLGTLQQAHQQMQRMNQANANRVSVRLELQADFYAGVWGHYESTSFGSLEDGDLMEAINCASKIGDDYLQKKSQGYAVEESFTHGTATQRMKWLKKGLQTGDIRQGNTFELSDSQL